MCKLCMQVCDCKSLLLCPISMVFPQGELLVAITCFFQSARVSYLSGPNSRGFEGSFVKVFFVHC